MVGISWTDAEGFCRFLSQRDGRQYRLPTEAEWEYAARGGLEGKMYPWGDETATPDRCNYLNRRPVPVACYPANGYGLFDMVGNNFEWTADFYLKDTYARTPAEVTDPTGPDEAQAEELSPDKARTRVVRGGGWMSNEMSKINCRNSWRLGWPEVFHHGNIGVRVVADAE
jgi:formylglycine-generating enzyme required for sulfatase activity